MIKLFSAAATTAGIVALLMSSGHPKPEVTFTPAPTVGDSTSVSLDAPATTTTVVTKSLSVSTEVPESPRRTNPSKSQVVVESSTTSTSTTAPEMPAELVELQKRIPSADDCEHMSDACQGTDYVDTEAVNP